MAIKQRLTRDKYLVSRCYVIRVSLRLFFVQTNSSYALCVSIVIYWCKNIASHNEKIYLFCCGLEWVDTRHN